VSEDRSQVGLTEEATEKVTQLRTDTPYFAEESDVYRLGVAVALALGADVSESLKSARLQTKFRVVRDYGDDSEASARLDTPDGRLARLISLHRPEWSSEPYRYSQYLAIIGINYLHRALIERQDPLAATLAELHDRESNGQVAQ
jgi:hypothetical protein